MKKVNFILLLAIGLMNLFPVIGVISTDQLAELYGVTIHSPDLEVLMRHRAVLLGLVGALLVFAAFRSSLQVLATSIGLVSMSSFVVLAYMSGDIGAEINKVVVADIAGCVAAVIVLILATRAHQRL